MTALIIVLIALTAAAWLAPCPWCWIPAGLVVAFAVAVGVRVWRTEK